MIIKFWSRVPRDTWNLVGSREDHLPRLNTTWWPIVEQYREGKVKRTPGGEWKRTWNPVFTSCGTTNKVGPRTFCRTVRREAVTGEVKYLRYGAEGKPSLNRASSQWRQTRNRVIYPCPGWSGSKVPWRSEHTSVEKGGDEVWIGEKFQSNPEIAGSPRNSFRASLDGV